MSAHLLDQTRIVRVMNAVAAGVTDQNSSSVDMTQDGGYDEVEFVALLGALTAAQVTKLDVQDSPDDVTYTSITGALTAALADADSNKLLASDLLRPAKRYARAVVKRATANAAIDGVIAILHRSRSQKTTQIDVKQSTKIVGNA